MFRDIFLGAGLSPTQAQILEFLYEKKEAKASVVAKKIKKSRTIVYKDLEEMIKLDVVEKVAKPGKPTLFSIGHPTHMEKFFDKKENEVKRDRKLFNSYLPDMVSSYNIMHNKPGVRYYEGREGFEFVVNDSLTAKTDIYSYMDTKNTIKSSKELVTFYAGERAKKGIKKKIIEPDNAYIRKYLLENGEEVFSEDALTQTKFLDKGNFSFDTIMQIYDNKISYSSYEGKSAISVIIEDKKITDLHKQIFECNWQKAKTLEQLA